MRLWQALDLWKTTLMAEGRRASTLKTYTEHLRPAFRYLEEREIRDVIDLNPFVIRSYLADYGSTHSPYGLKSIFITLRAFCNWLVREGLLTESPLARLKPPKAHPSNRATYSQGQLKALLASLAADKTALGFRDMAIVSLLTETGMRASEMCSLMLDDLSGDSLLLRRTKSGRSRMVFLGRRASQALQRYLAFGRPRLRPSGAALLLTHAGQPIGRNALRQMLERRGKQVGFRLSAHRFRHTWTTQLLRQGVDLETLRLLGGWTDYTMLKTYVHLLSDDLKETLRHHSPLDRL